MTLSDKFNCPIQETELRVRYTDYCNQHLKARRRDIAQALSVSEAALIDEQLGVQSIRLNNDFKAIIERLPTLGYIMTLMRNDFAVHERKGIYQNIRISPAMGMVIADDRRIDLRLFMKRWQYGYAVKESTGNQDRYSLQFFDGQGVAIQKIFLQLNSNIAAYETIIEQFSEKSSNIETRDNRVFMENREIEEFVDDALVDQHKFIEDWANLTDVHQFIMLLKRHKISRQQSLRLVGSEYAQSFAVNKIEFLLAHAATTALPIMCFVGNYGAIQIHTGPIKTVKRMGDWLNILDSEFNLHLLDAGIAHAWLVRKPTVDGIITSLELYDNEGSLIVQFFGKREEGKAENPAWRALAESVLTLNEELANTASIG